jgi:hypothetical protein
VLLECQDTEQIEKVKVKAKDEMQPQLSMYIACKSLCEEVGRGRGVLKLKDGECSFYVKKNLKSSINS